MASEAVRRKAAKWPARLKDAVGIKVRLTRETSTGLMTIPQGAEGVVGNLSISWTKLEFRGVACERCGCQPRVTRLDWRDLEVIR